MSLAAARETAFTNRQSARRGENPIASRALARQPSHRTASAPTFAVLTEDVIEIRRAGWRSERTETRWRGGLRDYAATLLDRPIDQITTADVLAVIGPIWNSKRTAAERVIHHIAQTLNLPVAKGYRADYSGTEHFARRLEALGRAPEAYFFEKEGHGMSRWQTRTLLMRAIEKFLARHLGGRDGGFDHVELAARYL